MSILRNAFKAKEMEVCLLGLDNRPHTMPASRLLLPTIDDVFMRLQWEEYTAPEFD